MEGSQISPELNAHLDILGRQPLLNIYTQITLCFSLNGNTSHEAIVSILENGLQRLSKSFPWVAGQVMQETLNDDAATFKIKPFEKAPRIVVKDLRDDRSIPSMDTLRGACFPFNMLREDAIAPVNTFPGTPTVAKSNGAPVFLVQANFIYGGLLLTLVGEHRTMDMTGQGQIMHLLSKACRNESFTAEELLIGNLDRLDTLSLLDGPYDPGPELAYQISRDQVDDSDTVNSNNDHMPAPPSCVWSYFTFSSSSLVSLKSIACSQIQSGITHVSTDDSLSAFVWQSVMRARLPRLQSTDSCTFARAVDVRRYLDISPSYPGLMQNMTYHTYPIQTLVNQPLGAIASQLRTAVDPKTSNLAYNTRALGTYFARAPDKSKISFTATLDLSIDLMLSSWAKLDCYELDFGLGLGKPEAVRRPQFTTVESLLYLMPKARNGEIAVAICLRTDDMENLKADPHFAKFARVVD